jgi:hypothetical protein
MECWIFLLLGVVALVGVGSVAGIVAVVRSRDDRRRLAALQEEVSGLDTAVTLLRREIHRLGGAEAGGEARIQPAPGATAASTVTPPASESIAARAGAAAWTARGDTPIGREAGEGLEAGTVAGAPPPPAGDRVTAGAAAPGMPAA